jgi:hypothetical protein
MGDGLLHLQGDLNTPARAVPVWKGQLAESVAVALGDPIRGFRQSFIRIISFDRRCIVLRAILTSPTEPGRPTECDVQG